MQDFLSQDADTLRLFGVTSAIISVYAFLPYIRDTLAGRTCPQRASWLIWSVLGAIALGSQIYEGASASLWFASIQVGGTVSVFVLSIWRGTGTFVNSADACVLFAAAIGLLAWALTDTAVYALAITITISLMGGAMTVAKAYHAPGTETLTMWLSSLFAAALAMAAVGTWDWVLLAYPLYLFTLNGAIVVAMSMGQTRKAPVPVFYRRHTKNAAQDPARRSSYQ